MCMYKPYYDVVHEQPSPQHKRTALHLTKDVETVRILVAAGGDLDAKDAVRK